MKPISSQMVFLAAAGVLAAGGAIAAQLYLSPPKYSGPSTQQILATSERLNVELPRPPDAAELAARARAAGSTVRFRSAIVDPSPRPLRQTPAVTERALSAANRTQTPTPTLDVSPPPVAPGANLALTGIAGTRGEREALLFNLTDSKRESGSRGDTVFGFTIAAIRDDSVDLQQGSTQLTLRMGEKAAAVEAALAAPATNPDGTLTVASNSSGTGIGSNSTNGQNGRGGNRRSAMAANAIQASFNAQGGNRNRGNWNNQRGTNGRRNNNRRSSTTSSGARRYSNGPGASSRYSTVSSGSTNRNSRMGGFRGGGGFGGFGGRGRNNQGLQTFLEATSNPQEARRTGAPLIGGIDVEAMFEPEALTNPQTERRTGSATGQAFGNSSYNGYNNRSGSNRAGFGNTGRNTGGRSSGTRRG